jgi:hypothetical protein
VEAPFVDYVPAFPGDVTYSEGYSPHFPTEGFSIFGILCDWLGLGVGRAPHLIFGALGLSLTAGVLLTFGSSPRPLRCIIWAAYFATPFLAIITTLLCFYAVVYWSPSHQ